MDADGREWRGGGWVGSANLPFSVRLRVAASFSGGLGVGGLAVVEEGPGALVGEAEVFAEGPGEEGPELGVAELAGVVGQALGEPVAVVLAAGQGAAGQEFEGALAVAAGGGVVALGLGDEGRDDGEQEVARQGEGGDGRGRDELLPRRGGGVLAAEGDGGAASELDGVEEDAVVAFVPGAAGGIGFGLACPLPDRRAVVAAGGAAGGAVVAGGGDGLGLHEGGDALALEFEGGWGGGFGRIRVGGGGAGWGWREGGSVRTPAAAGWRGWWGGSVRTPAAAW